MLTRADALVLRARLAAAGYETDPAGPETWFSPETDLHSRTIFFGDRPTGVLVWYSDAQTPMAELASLQAALDTVGV